MGINKIELPSIVIEELYHSSLVVDRSIERHKKIKEKEIINDLSSIAEETQNNFSKSLGNNNKKILVMVHSEEAVHLPDNELTFLTGILSACNLSLADVVIINKNNYPNASYKELTKFFSSKIVLLFDVEPSEFDLPMSFPFYQIQSFANNSFLYSPSLKDLENNKVEKSKLWVSLKRLFNL